MKKGDLVKHRHGTLAGYGIVLYAPPGRGHTLPSRLKMMWYCEGYISFQKLDKKYIEVISESR